MRTEESRKLSFRRSRSGAERKTLWLSCLESR